MIEAQQVMYTHFTEAEAEWRWIYFEPKEMRCTCCGKLLVVSEFMDRLQALRGAYDLPMIVTSGYRCPDYNEKISTTGRSGVHTKGRAVDIKVNGESAWDLVRYAMTYEVRGIGIKLRGPHNARFVHLDDDPARQKPIMWSY
ncbi:MAG: D-Ala-D-Ala carboxypeptidase family metallohydrolase [Geminicoccaceae bacterium]